MVASEAEGRAEALRRIAACRTAQAEELDLGGLQLTALDGEPLATLCQLGWLRRLFLGLSAEAREEPQLAFINEEKNSKMCNAFGALPGALFGALTRFERLALALNRLRGLPASIATRISRKKPVLKSRVPQEIGLSRRGTAWLPGCCQLRGPAWRPPLLAQPAVSGALQRVSHRWEWPQIHLQATISRQIALHRFFLRYLFIPKFSPQINCSKEPLRFDFVLLHKFFKVLKSKFRTTARYLSQFSS